MKQGDIKMKNFTGTEKIKIKIFFEAGKKSFLNGGSRTPALNKEYMDLVKANAEPIGKFSIACLTAFIDGWTLENLREPIPEWSDKENANLYNLDRPHFKKYEEL